MLLCLLLCACQKENTETILPEDSTLQTKTSQEILEKESTKEELEEESIEDTKDTFFVDTGGVLGTLLVTVEWEEINPYEDFCAILHFAVWNQADMDSPIQTMEANSNVFRHKEVVDANFDGYQDFGYMYAQGNQPNYWHFWIWDEDGKQFVEETEFDFISCPEFDLETETIRGWARSSAMGTGAYTIHQWVNGKLICMRRIDIGWDSDNDGIDLIVTDFVENKQMEVYRKNFPPNSSEYFDEEMKWYDLDYCGES